MGSFTTPHPQHGRRRAHVPRATCALVSIRPGQRARSRPHAHPGLRFTAFCVRCEDSLWRSAAWGSRENGPARSGFTEASRVTSAPAARAITPRSPGRQSHLAGKSPAWSPTRTPARTYPPPPRPRRGRRCCVRCPPRGRRTPTAYATRSTAILTATGLDFRRSTARRRSVGGTSGSG